MTFSSTHNSLHHFDHLATDSGKRKRRNVSEKLQVTFFQKISENIRPLKNRNRSTIKRQNGAKDSNRITNDDKNCDQKNQANIVGEPKGNDANILKKMQPQVQKSRTTTNVPPKIEFFLNYILI